MYPNNNFYSAVLCPILSLLDYSSRAGIIAVFNKSCNIKTVKFVNKVQYESLYISFWRSKVFKEGWIWSESISYICIRVQEFPMLAEIDIPYRKCLCIYFFVKSNCIDTLDGLFVACVHPLGITVFPQVLQDIIFALRSYMHLFWSVKILNLVMCSPLWITTLFILLFQSVENPVNNLFLSLGPSIIFSASS